MSPDRGTQFVETSMSSDAIDTLLESQGYGVLSLCRDGEPYSIPVSFGYDGEAVYIPFLITGDDAAKQSFVEAGSVARFLVTDVRGLFDWRSVSVTDTVQPVPDDTPEWDRFIETLLDNGWFRREFESAASIDSVNGWKLGLDDLKGMKRETVSYE